MTQRNFQNARNMGDGPKGKSRKSASSAKIKSKAGSSVYTPSKEARAKREKAQAKARARSGAPAAQKGVDPAEQVRRRERAMVSMMRDMPEYKHWRRIWWVLMIVAFAAVIVTWIPNFLVSNGTLSDDWKETTTWISSIGFIFALIALVGAFYIDLRKIRKIQKTQEAKARNLTKSERRELDQAIDAAVERDQQQREAKKAKRPWGKKKAEQASDDAEGSNTSAK